jgi:hypothetical protein
VILTFCVGLWTLFRKSLKSEDSARNESDTARYTISPFEKVIAQRPQFWIAFKQHIDIGSAICDVSTAA